MNEPKKNPRVGRNLKPRPASSTGGQETAGTPQMSSADAGQVEVQNSAPEPVQEHPETGNNLEDQVQSSLKEMLARSAGTAPVKDVGEKPSGDYGVVIAIPEFYVETCRQFGEADGGKSIEQWAQEFFVSNLEAYFAPAKKH